MPHPAFICITGTLTPTHATPTHFCDSRRLCPNPDPSSCSSPVKTATLAAILRDATPKGLAASVFSSPFRHPSTGSPHTKPIHLPSHYLRLRVPLSLDFDQPKSDELELPKTAAQPIPVSLFPRPSERRSIRTTWHKLSSADTSSPPSSSSHLQHQANVIPAPSTHHPKLP